MGRWRGVLLRSFARKWLSDRTMPSDQSGEEVRVKERDDRVGTFMDPVVTGVYAELDGQGPVE